MGVSASVMYAGHRVEYAQSVSFTNPLHPYAQGLIASIPSFDAGPPKGTLCNS